MKRRARPPRSHGPYFAFSVVHANGQKWLCLATSEREARAMSDHSVPELGAVVSVENLGTLNEFVRKNITRQDLEAITVDDLKAFIK